MPTGILRYLCLACQQTTVTTASRPAPKSRSTWSKCQPVSTVLCELLIRSLARLDTDAAHRTEGIARHQPALHLPEVFHPDQMYLEGCSEAKRVDGKSLRFRMPNIGVELSALRQLRLKLRCRHKDIISQHLSTEGSRVHVVRPPIPSLWHPEARAWQGAVIDPTELVFDASVSAMRSC